MSQLIQLEHCIKLPGRVYRNFFHSDLAVSMNRIGYDQDFDNDLLAQACKELNLPLENTTEQPNGVGYIGNMEWKQAIKLNLSFGPGRKTLSLRRFMDLRELLYSGQEIEDGLGSKLPLEKIDEITDEIFGKRDPWRGEYLDNRFEKISEGLLMHTGHTLSETNLTPQSSELLEEHLKKQGVLNFARLNDQGLPVKETTEIYYWLPTNGSVAGFEADSGRVDLDCGGVPSVADPVLSVRVAQNFLE